MGPRRPERGERFRGNGRGSHEPVGPHEVQQAGPEAGRAGRREGVQGEPEFLGRADGLAGRGVVRRVEVELPRGGSERPEVVAGPGEAARSHWRA